MNTDVRADGARGTRQTIYLDHAATTPLVTEALDAMLPFLTELAGNPSSIHSVGRAARRASDLARAEIAGLLGCAPEELVLTSGGTEADNLAVNGAARANAHRGRHVITSAIEHHAVLRSCEALAAEGFQITVLPVDRHGLIRPTDLEAALRPDTVLVSVMAANNEIGSIQPVRELTEIARRRGVIFHTDAVQAMGQLDITVDGLGVDLLSLSAHKFYGPRGVGMLYVRDGTPVHPIVLGGGQEFGRRSGTENVAGLVGMAAALKLARAGMESQATRTAKLRDILMTELGRIDGATITGHPTRRLPSIASFAFRDIDAESLLISLDLDGIQASAGSACTAGSLEISHVIEALGLPAEFAAGTLRLSVGRLNDEAQIRRAVEVVTGHVARLRGQSGGAAGTPARVPGGRRGI